MPIIISKTYEVIDCGNEECCEPDERGFVFEDVPYTFRELVEELENDGYNELSQSFGVPCWVSVTYDDMSNFSTVTESLHSGRDARSQRYWEKALRAAGLIK